MAMSLETERKQGFLSAAVLKNTAYITMFIDHFFAVVYLAVLGQHWLMGTVTDGMEQIYRAGRAVGRISFILFAYLAVEGFLHTRSRRNYLFRLGIFAFVSEIPFDLAFSGKWFDPANQNVFFTLFLGILVLTVWEWAGHSDRGQNAYCALGENSFMGSILWAAGIFWLILCCVVAYLLHTDYRFMGVLLIFAFYQTRERKLSVQILTVGCVMLFGTWGANCLRYAGEYSAFYLLCFSIREMYGLFAFFWIGLYNGKKGVQLPKAFYYGFYPVHLFLLHCVTVLAAGEGM